MGTYAGMYQGLGVKVTTDIIAKVKQILKGSLSDTVVNSKVHDSQSHDQSLLAKAHRGLFLGSLALSGTIISIILFFFFMRSKETEHIGTATYHITDLTLGVLMLAAAILAMVRLYGLAYTEHRNNKLDNFLLVISMIGLFLYEMFTMLSGFVSISHGDHSAMTIADCTSSMISILQALFQIMLIVDGLQRFSSREDQRLEKPGRGTVTFLLILNVAMWIFKTFEVKELWLERQREFFGETAWPMIVNINLPLMLFFRFHSSVCLADIYFMAYKDEEE